MTLEHEPTVCHKVCQVPYAQPTAPSCVVWSWALIKGCFAPVLVVKGRLHKALGPIAARQLCYMCMPMRPEKAGNSCPWLLLPGSGAHWAPSWVIWLCVRQTAGWCLSVSLALLFEKSYLSCRLCQMCVNSHNKNRMAHPYG